jgi:oxazoline/thiazoline dehydrogenase
LRVLAVGGSEAELTAARAADDPIALAAWIHFLNRLRRVGAVAVSLRHRRRVLARLIPMAGGPLALAPPPDGSTVLSRFAVLTRRDDDWSLETPRSGHRVELPTPAGMAMVSHLSRPCTVAELAAAAGVSLRVAGELVQLLAAAELVSRSAEGSAAEALDPDLVGWSPVDLLFHARSRPGRHDAPTGATYPFRDVAPAPVTRPPAAGAFIALPRADLARLRRRDRSFTEVLEARRSRRRHARRAIDRDTLGEFLHRAARLDTMIPADGTALLYPASRRPYPGGGACYELEIYLAVNRCRGLARGIYHYDPARHGLESLGHPALVRRLLAHVNVGEYGAHEHQVLLTLTARFRRVSWKYEGITYAVVLKDVGVLLQTMYLVATAMNLAPCALGSGPADLLLEAIGTRYEAESPVGEFLLGTPAD